MMSQYSLVNDTHELCNSAQINYGAGWYDFTQWCSYDHYLGIAVHLTNNENNVEQMITDSISE